MSPVIRRVVGIKSAAITVGWKPAMGSTARLQWSGWDGLEWADDVNSPVARYVSRRKRRSDDVEFHGR